MSFLMSPIIFKAKKGKPHLEMPRLGLFRILLLKLSLRINAANFFKDQRRHSNHLATVMIRAIPCNRIDC